MKVLANVGFGIERGALGKDHTEGILAGAHANYHFTYPPGNEWPLNKQFVERYHKRWNEYPNYAAEGAYTTLYLLKYAIEKANDLLGTWPEPSQIITMLEGMVMATPAGYLYIRPEDHSVSSRRSLDSARTCRNIHFQSGILTDSSCKTSATCRRPPIGQSRGTATMIRPRRTIGSRRPGRHDRFESCRLTDCGAPDEMRMPIPSLKSSG